jgi:hypothetical protein
MKTIDKILFGFGIFIFSVGIFVFIKLSYTLIISPSYNLSDLTPYAILLSALIAAVAMYLSTRINIIIDNKNKTRDLKNKQFEFMMNLYNFYYTHEGIRSIRFAIEYDNFTYESAKKGSDNEKYLFALLRYFENVCLMYHNETLSDQEIEPILYDMKKVYLNGEVQQFIDEILTRHKSFNTKPPYSNYLKFCKNNF